MQPLTYRTWDQAETVWPDLRIFPSLPLNARSVIHDALMYAEMGLHVLPGVPGLKMPFYGSKWADASCDADEVCRLFERHPEADVLVLCGPSKIAAVDVDPRNYGVTPAGLPEGCWIMDTPKGGNQFVFTDPESLVPTTAARISEGVDTRGVGGLIVVPSSNSPKRKWASRPGSRPSVVWPYERFKNLGTPTAKVAPQIDPETGEIWTPVDTIGERITPNEHCPGPEHKNGDRTPSLGRFRMPDGTTRHSCFSGCPDEEVQELLVSEGRYLPEELYGYALPAEPAEGEQDGKLRFISEDELMALQPPKWMIEPYIAEQALIQLTAKFNVGKTFVAVNWALDLSYRGKKVLYVALEGLTGLQKRVTAWKDYHAKVEASRVVFSPKGYTLNLLSERSVAELCDTIKDGGGYDLVVIDNLGECVPGDENDSEIISRAMASLNKIRAASGGAVLDLHNSGHGGTTRARGHSKMLDAHDTVIYLEAIEGSLNGLNIRSGKERNAERFVTRRAQLKPVAGSLVAVMGSAALAQADPLYNAVKLGHDTATKAAQYLERPKTTVFNQLKKLVDNGDLTEAPLQGKEVRYECVWEQSA